MKRAMCLTRAWTLVAGLVLVLAVGCGGDDPEETPPTGSDASSGTDTTPAADTPVSEDVSGEEVTPTQARRVVFLHTNDLHAHENSLGPLLDYTPESVGDDDTMGGFARLGALLKAERANLPEGASSLTLDAGDFSYGSAFAALGPIDSAELRLLDLMGYDATTLGNHEMDYGPAVLADVLEAGLETASKLIVLSSNLVFDETSAADDALAAQVGTYLHPYKVIELDNGLKVGLFGILGEGAHSLSPHAEPVTVRPSAEAAKEMATLLREQEGVDLVVCLSHSGVAEDEVPGEDEAIAEATDEIDVIISGHSHTLMSEPLIVNDTVIVQAGSYSAYFGKLVLVETEDGFDVESWAANKVDDSVAGDPDLLTEIAAFEAKLNTTMFAGMGVGYRDPVLTTDFDLLPIAFNESNLGDLVADGLRVVASKYTETPIDITLEANGTIREGIQKGQTGQVLLGDLVRVLPLGAGPNHELGYPVIHAWLNAKEVRLALEVIVSVAPIMSNSFYLQVSGLRFEYDPDGAFFGKVQKIFLGNEIDGFSDEPLDITADNTQLYHVAVNLYSGQMLGLLKSSTGGAVAIELKDKDGVVHEDPLYFLLDTDPATDGLQELKVWRTLYDYVAAFPVDAATGLPKIPARYEHSQERIKSIAE